MLLDAFWLQEEELVVKGGAKGHRGNGTPVYVANSPIRWTRERESRIDGGLTRGYARAL